MTTRFTNGHPDAIPSLKLAWWFLNSDQLEWDLGGIGPYDFRNAENADETQATHK